METLDKYQVLEKIGVGGFGVVYKAYDPFIKRAVAIKTCTSEDAEMRERFMREAEIAGNLHHRNIVTVYDFGFKDGVPYLVQEYLSGEDLDRKIKRREFLSLPEKLLYLVQIVRGLQYAHSRGVVHRDIKPANIRILEDDTAKIMDFGIAKLAHHDQVLTQVGITLGTAAYLAPEQIRGGAFDARTDLFSFGILAFELFALERPFQGAEISAVFYKILNEPAPSLRDKARDCPPELERIVARCLEKEPERRYPGCSELLADIESLAHSRPRETGSELVTAPFSNRTIAAERGAPLPTTAPSPAGGTAPAAPATPSPRPLSLGEIVLDARAAPPTQLAEGPATVAFERRPRAGKWIAGAVAALVLAAAAGWGGWRYWEESRPMAAALPAPAALPSEAAKPPVATTPASASTTALPAVDARLPPAGTSPPGESTAPLPGPAAAPAASEPAAEPPPPAPVPAVLTVAAAWDSGMTMRLGSKVWNLDRERRLELAAGSYKLRFSIETPVYSHAAETTVRLKEGERRQIVSPIERPGKLTVQPHINARQAFVRLDGASAVPTPLRGRWLAPGAHVVEIVGTQEPGAPVLRTERVEIRSENESILTFDLDGRSPQRLAEKPILPN
ncbi:MAG: serine/threonine protein kinase [Thermoanaerobaculia bacterium]|nr:serine/threonine protein kinase [Thermoanaerobaculia bacterium]